MARGSCSDFSRLLLRGRWGPAGRGQQIAEIAALLLPGRLRRCGKFAQVPIPLNEAEDGDEIHLLVRNVVRFRERRDDEHGHPRSQSLRIG